MKYQVVITPQAEREMDALTPIVHQRVSGRVLALEDEPFPPACKKLTGIEGFRLRVGDWRVFYTINHAAHIVCVSSVKHRREAYRKHR